MEMTVVAPPGETWDADGNEEALVRNPHGFATYSMRDVKVAKPKPKRQPEPEPPPEPEPQSDREPHPDPRPKKKHKRFTSPAPDIGDESVKAYQKKLQGLLDDAVPEARASMAPPQREENPESDDVQDYQDTLKALEASTRPKAAQSPMSPPPRPERRQEKQDTSEPSQGLMPPPPRPRRRQERQDTPETERRQERQNPPRLRPEWGGLTEEQYKHLYRWKFSRRIGDDYSPTARELAKAITVPKRPSPLSQVQNAESDIPTTPSPSPPHSPRLETNKASKIQQRTPEGERRYREWLSHQPACPPRAGDKELEIVHRAPLQTRQEMPKLLIPAPDQSPQACHERICRWKDFVRRYHVLRNRPTSRELAQVIVVPKNPSPLSQVLNADSDDSTTPTSSPPHSPRLRPRPNTVVRNFFRSFEDTLLHMEDLDEKPARNRCLPRPRDPELKVIYRAPPEKEVKIIGWQLSNEMRDVCYLIQLVGSPSAPL
jgi:hypothetical protein